MKVVLLAGGFGTRISEESQFKPKPMIEIGGTHNPVFFESCEAAFVLWCFFRGSLAAHSNAFQSASLHFLCGTCAFFVCIGIRDGGKT